MNKQIKIFLAGHRGLVGSAILKRLEAEGYTNLLLRTHAQLDLTRQAEVEAFFEKERPEMVVLAAAKVGGIVANSTYPADFLFENLAIAQNVIHSAYLTGVKKLINLGSSCIYPRMAPQPLKEEYLLTGPLEVTNEAYAVAKIAAIRLCKHFNDQYGTNFISAMPTNLYGPGDNYDLKNSHVLPAMIRKFHEGKVGGEPVVLWGDGSPLREFLYSEDLADAVVFLLENKNYSEIGEFINVGSGKEISIRDLAGLVSRVVGYTGKVQWDTSKPNGTPRKLMDSQRLFNLGWTPHVDLEEGLKRVYQDFLKLEKSQK
ncbi:MAG: GDP-L-fucose synthase [Spirochaetales bacterium]|nr:GDP-L-fucose synthase [Spirochaetales bacterium]